MKSLAVAVPLAPGMIEELRRFGAEVQGPRRNDHTESRRNLGITKELCFVQPTPQGDIFVLYLEGENPVEANKEFAASNSPYNLWFKEQARPIFAPTGVDFSQPIPPISEQLFEWDDPARNDEGRTLQPGVIVVPILPGKSETFREAVASIRQERRSAHQESRKRLGIYAERVWIENTPQGDLLLGYFEAEDLQRVFTGLATSQEPYDVWFRELNKEIVGVDLSQPLPVPPPELVLDWQDNRAS
ncbi:MAG: DUF6176 family protein [Chloroflexota bacterium]|nr:DUF6176 family protein [Chloroflexota bacterium]